jgi:hypothetical protein
VGRSGGRGRGIGRLRRYLLRLAKSESPYRAVRISLTAVMQFLITVKLTLVRLRQPPPPVFHDRWDFLESAIRLVGLSGEWCEFGVFRGESLRFIAGRTTSIVHGFDSFQGLPEGWAHLGAGAFGLGGQVPEIPSNVRLHVGPFEITVPAYVQESTPTAMAFIHVDSDLYDSAVTVLRNLRPQLVPGSVVVLDELLGVFHNDEYTAVRDELLDAGFRITWTGFYLYPEWGVAASLRVDRVGA